MKPRRNHAKNNLARYREEFDENGFLSPVRLISEQRAADHRRRFEAAEAALSKPLHYLSKMHTILTSPWELVSDPDTLDIVEALIGPDILLFNVTYIVKEPGTASFVSWHQDLTYWGFDGDDQVSMWLALSPATEQSGCMRMIPGSHRKGQIAHTDGDDPDNVLHRSQTIGDVDESTAVATPLAPGEASFHHGWTMHASAPNQSSDRRIGLNVQYIRPSLKQTVGADETAILVRGTDRFRHYGRDIPAESDLDPDALARVMELDRQTKETWTAA